MTPDVFPLIAADSDCEALLGSGPMRLFPFGEAPQHVTLPYVTWQTVAGVPENYMDCAPDIDSLTVQVDVWAATQGSASEVRDAVVAALETDAHVVGIGLEGREPDTRLYRVSLTVDFWTKRT
jgi:hypothetical protein